MQDENLRDHAVTLEVPSELVEVFCEQAHRTLHHAADSLEEAARWQAEGSRAPEQVAHERVKVRMASDLLDQTYVSEAAMEVTADRATLASTLQGCLIEVGQELHGECERTADAPTRAVVRGCMGRVESVLSLMEQVERKAS